MNIVEKSMIAIIAIIAIAGLTAAVGDRSETDIAVRALALDSAVQHHGNLLVQEGQVDVVVTANRFERYLRLGYGR